MADTEKSSRGAGIIIVILLALLVLAVWSAIIRIESPSQRTDQYFKFAAHSPESIKDLYDRPSAFTGNADQPPIGDYSNNNGPTAHTVRQGETPAIIANTYGVSLGNLQAANPGSTFAPGSTVNIPSPDLAKELNPGNFVLAGEVFGAEPYVRTDPGFLFPLPPTIGGVFKERKPKDELFTTTQVPILLVEKKVAKAGSGFDAGGFFDNQIIAAQGEEVIFQIKVTVDRQRMRGDKVLALYDYMTGLETEDGDTDFKTSIVIPEGFGRYTAQTTFRARVTYNRGKAINIATVIDPVNNIERSAFATILVR